MTQEAIVIREIPEIGLHVEETDLETEDMSQGIVRTLLAIITVIGKVIAEILTIGRNLLVNGFVEVVNF